MNPKEKQPSFGGGPSRLRLAEDKELEAAVDVAVAAADAPASGCRCFVPVGCSGDVPVAYSRRCTPLMQFANYASSEGVIK